MMRLRLQRGWICNPNSDRALTEWFTDCLGLEAGGTVLAIEKPKTGFSADTLLVALQGRRHGVAIAGDYVVRLERSGRHTFLGSSIAKQAETMRALRANGIPAPVVIGAEPDDRLAGWQLSSDGTSSRSRAEPTSELSCRGLPPRARP